ncbi:MAG: MBL fold metallo-hydrolase [Chloroflexi bacterium]|nr:MAG: MBL fold metallo-hydrolase [Chloroflexota bacterium]MBL1192890.1 MBL fold metallo-hydrolase [Chloroflexota bacterium]NOH10182.1 MBL fold metallo-hydrolase [Chloroflexota bacterium]
MQLQLIRNATMRLHYGSQLLLLDPDLAPKHAREPLAGVQNNPIVGLPMSTDEIMADINAILVSHLHQDHFDAVAQEDLPKDLPLFCQPEDVDSISDSGFTQVLPIKDELIWESIRFSRTAAQHGFGKWAEMLAPVSGFVLQAAREPTVYWAGDTVWYPAVQAVIDKFKPEVIIIHSSGAELEDSGPIVMDLEQSVLVCQSAPNAKVVAVHLESLDHGKVSRDALRVAAEEAGVGERLSIPLDGEGLDF